MKMKRIRLILLLVGILFIFAGIYFAVYGIPGTTPRFGVIDESILIQIPQGALPADTLYISEGRRQYTQGKMTLIIPSIDVYTPVGESTEPDGLKEMPGLYEFSQLPDIGDVNVSIAGHRDIYDQIFLHTDQIASGDYAYLLYGDMVYRYIYRDTKIVKPNNWDVIKPQGFSCLTLTTCDPVGTTLNRLIVRLELIDYQPYSEDYQFLNTENPLP